MVQELNDAEQTIVKDVQERHFGQEVRKIKECGTVQAPKLFNQSSWSHVKYLNPVVDGYGILHVGGRIGKSSLERHTRFPVILPLRTKKTVIKDWNTHMQNYVRNGGSSKEDNELSQ